MTTNDATPREAIAIALVNSLVDVWQSDDTVVIHADHIDPAVNEIVAHLWQAADDAGVQDAGTHTEHLLTAILGPRPQESNDE